MQGVLDFLSGLLGTIFFFLPDDPFMPIIESMSGGEWLGALNWFIPVGTLIGIGGAWLTAIGIFYAYQAVLRIANIIGS